MTEEELRAVEEDLQREAAEDSDLRAQYGQRWNRPASVALNSQITEKIAGAHNRTFVGSLSFHLKVTIDQATLPPPWQIYQSNRRVGM